MGIYLLCCSISFGLGWLVAYLFKRHDPVEVKIQGSEIRPKIFTDIRLQKIQIMLEEIKRCGTIPVKMPKAAEQSLMIIAQTPDWDKQIDEETIKTLNRIYNSWQMHIESEKKCKIGRGAKTGKLEGYKRPEWEGTFDEYKKAVEQGIITQDTKITIIEDENPQDYHGEWVELKNDGSYEEFMD